MKRRRQATLAIPVVILLLGVVIPVTVRSGGRAPEPPTRAELPRRAGKTACEWRGMALAALEREDYDRAISYMKTAEAVSPGVQYADELRDIRRARRRAREVLRNRDRLLGGPIEHIEFGPRGEVRGAFRVAVVLPGESLWSLAALCVAAQRDALPKELPARGCEIYRFWDRLTGLNGVRELEVGERVRVPLPEAEERAIADANLEDLARIERAMRALDDRDLESATRLRNETVGAFGRGTNAFSELEQGLVVLRSEELVEKAHALIADAEALPRASRHSDVVASLREARDLIVEANRLVEGTVDPHAIEEVERMLSEAERYHVEEDGAVVTTKPAGAAYTDVARSAVEWFVGRELAFSGVEFPHHDLKTDDEIAWARYLAQACAMARRDGINFAGLLESTDVEAEIRLPNTAGYFAD